MNGGKLGCTPRGNYHNVSKKYLPFYLNEFSYRFNNRKNENMFADLITTCSQ